MTTPTDTPAKPTWLIVTEYLDGRSERIMRDEEAVREHVEAILSCEREDEVTSLDVYKLETHWEAND